MVVLVVIGAAIVIFLAGWWASRTFGRSPEPIPAADTSPSAPSYRSVLDQQATGIVVAGPTGDVEYRNPAAQAMAGTTVGVLIDEAIGRHLRTSLAGEQSEETIDLYGPPRMVAHIDSRALTRGRAVAFVTDISERRRIDQVRTDFVANVSHELRTPIGALMVLAETLADNDDPEVTRRVIERMQGEAERASRTIDDLLELSRVESITEIDAEPVRLSDVVREATYRVTELATRKGIVISTLDPVDDEGPRSESIVVDGDRQQLASAVGNLVENAVKYSDEGDIVQIRVRSADGMAEIAVIDQGSGIPRNDLDRIFERFYRVDRARSRSTGGTGLGLSIVRHVAQRHGGTIEVESVEGEGSTFRFTVPAGTNVDAEVDAHEEGTGVA